MAQFTKTNGDLLPVINYDSPAYTNSGANAVTSAATVQPQGPKLDFFKVLVKDGSATAVDLRDELGGYSGTTFNPGVVQQINQTVQTSSTIAIYQVEGSGTGQISYAIYPSGAYTASTLQTAIQGMGNVQITSSAGVTTGVNVSGTVVTQPGFQLA